MALKKVGAAPGKGVVQEPKAKYGYDYSKVPGWWWDPAAPPATTAVLKLDQPQTRVDRLLLRANIPATVRLQGPADLLFSAFSITLTAGSLDRNLALPEWGSSRAVSGANADWQEILLAAPARIEAVGVRSTTTSSDVRVEYRESYYRTYVEALNLSGFPIIQGKYIFSGHHEQAVVTQAIQLKLADKEAAILLSSPSLPSRVALALGDDTPAQIFPAEMELNGTVSSRDLTGQINPAWRRGISGGTAEVQLRITSLTDGVVQVDLSGAWGRSYTGAATDLALDSVNPMAMAVTWPFGELSEAQASLRLTGQIEGGRRMELVSGAPSFYVRTTERLEVAQAVRVTTGDMPAERRRVLAVWFMLPRLPRSEERIEVSLTEAAGDPPFPADEPVGRMEITLPVDAGAYTALADGYWYRAALEKPVELDGAQATSPLFVIAAGRENGSLLAHRSLGIAPESADRIPAAAGAGVGLVRNLDRTGAWEVQSFNRQAAHWLVDLELAPLESEHHGLIRFAYGNAADQAVPLAGASRVAVQTAYLSVQRPTPYSSGESSPPVLPVTLTSAVRANLTAQLVLYKPILGGS